MVFSLCAGAYNTDKRADKRPGGEHERKYNAPVADEIAMVEEQHGHGDIILHQRNGHITETYRAHDSLQYSLIFWNDQNEYHFQLCQKFPGTKQNTDQ